MITINTEFIFKGTPYQLAVFAIDFGERQLINNPLMWQQNTYATLPYMIFPKTFAIDRDANPISIAMIVDDPNPLAKGYLHAKLIGGRTLVTGAFDNEDWELYRERYESLYNELARLELIESSEGKQNLANAGVSITNSIVFAANIIGRDNNSYSNEYNARGNIAIQK